MANGCVSKLGKLHKFVASCAFEREVVDFNLQRCLVEECLAAMAAMPHELKVKTLEGGVVTIEVMPTTTIEKLKVMLHEKKHCEDPIEHQILKVKVVADGLLVDDDQTLESAGLLHAQSEVTVIYSRNEVEAATKEAIHAEGFLQANIPSSLTEIPAWAFHGCHQVVKVAIPKSVTAIRHAAFHDCKSLVSITIPASVMTIGHSAFQGCNSLASISIPDSVTVIGASAFWGCTSLESITIPESVTFIEDFAFAGCKSLTSMAIPHSVRAIGDSAFDGCSSLTCITIPESVTAIGDGAFAGCRSLTRITIPESLLDFEHVFDVEVQAFIQYL